MADPITVGAVVASALAIGGEALLTGVVGDLAKDGYTKLKEALGRRFPGVTASVVEKPESTPRMQALAEEIDGLSEQDKSALHTLAKELVEQLRSDEAAQRTVGAKIEKLVSEGLLRIGNIEVSGNASGLLAKEVRGKDVVLGDIKATGGN